MFITYGQRFTALAVARAPPAFEVYRPKIVRAGTFGSLTGGNAREGQGATSMSDDGALTDAARECAATCVAKLSTPDRFQLRSARRAA